MSTCYNNISVNCTIYGRLYNWMEAVEVCPKGWRLPNKNDWDELINVLGSDQKQLRSTEGWLNGHNGTNVSGLNFLPSGYGQNVIYLKYVGKGRLSMFWINNNSEYHAYSRQIGGYEGYNRIPIGGSSSKTERLSCRCIMDSNN